MSELADSAPWRKSTFSANGDCVEWVASESEVRVRHSLDPDGGRLTFTHSEWRAFVSGIKAGEGDLPPV